MWLSEEIFPNMDVESIVVWPYPESDVGDIVRGMFLLQDKTGATVSCIFKGIELSTSFFLVERNLIDYYYNNQVES